MIVKITDGRQDLKFLVQFRPHLLEVKIPSDRPRPITRFRPLQGQFRDVGGKSTKQEQWPFLTNSSGGLRGHGHRDNSLGEDVETQQPKRPFSFAKSKPFAWAAKATTQGQNQQQDQHPLIQLNLTTPISKPSWTSKAIEQWVILS